MQFDKRLRDSETDTRTLVHHTFGNIGLKETFENLFMHVGLYPNSRVFYFYSKCSIRFIVYRRIIGKIDIHYSIFLCIFKSV